MNGLIPERPEMESTMDVLVWNALVRSLEDDSVEWGSKVWNWIQLLDKHKLSALRSIAHSEFNRRSEETYNPSSPGYRTLDGWTNEKEPAEADS